MTKMQNENRFEQMKRDQQRVLERLQKERQRKRDE